MQLGSVCPLLLSSFVWTDCMAPQRCSLPSSRPGWGSSYASREYGLLDLPAVAARLTLPPDAQTTHPESGAQRALFDCPDLALLPCGPRVRLIVATHPATSTAKPPIGVLRAGTVYELFLTTAPQAAFTCADVLGLYLHRGSFETVLADEDREQDPDRWCSHAPCGQEFWQILNQWLWNLRLDLGQHLSPSPLRLTEFAPAAEPPSAPPSDPVEEPLAVAPSQPPKAPPAVLPSDPVEYGPAQWASPSFTKGFAGSDFVPQPDGTLRCPAGHPLSVHERRPERHGSVRVVYGARIVHCRPCPLRAQCQETTTTHKPASASAPFFGPLHPFQLNPLLTLLPLPASMKGRLFSPLLPLFCGETGHVVCFVVAGLVCCAHKPSSSPFALFHQKRISPATAMACKPEPNEPIGVSAGSSVWLAMPTHLRHLSSPSRSTDFLPLLPGMWV